MLVYNWWGIFTRMGTGGQHREAITTRPPLIEGIAQRTEHAREVAKKPFGIFYGGSPPIWSPATPLPAG